MEMGIMVIYDYLKVNLNHDQSDCNVMYRRMIMIPLPEARYFVDGQEKPVFGTWIWIENKTSDENS